MLDQGRYNISLDQTDYFTFINLVEVCIQCVSWQMAEALIVFSVTNAIG